MRTVYSGMSISGQGALLSSRGWLKKKCSDRIAVAYVDPEDTTRRTREVSRGYSSDTAIEADTSGTRHLG